MKLFISRFHPTAISSFPQLMVESSRKICQTVDMDAEKNFAWASYVPSGYILEECGSVRERKGVETRRPKDTNRLSPLPFSLTSTMLEKTRNPDHEAPQCRSFISIVHCVSLVWIKLGFSLVLPLVLGLDA